MFKVLCLGFAGLIFISAQCGDGSNIVPNLHSTIAQKLAGLPADLQRILEDEKETWHTWNAMGTLRFFTDGSIRKSADDLDVHAYAKKAKENGIEKLPATQMYQWLLATTAKILEEASLHEQFRLVALETLAKAIKEKYPRHLQEWEQPKRAKQTI